MSFVGDLQRFNSKLGTRMDMVVRRVCLGLAKDIVSMTPVDTGLARSNYFFGLTPPAGVDQTASKNGAPSITRSVEFASSLKAGQTFYLVNNLPYIMALEYGHSERQAPHGMARLAVAKWQAIVNRGAI